MRTIVQKFGGSSVSTSEKRQLVIKRILEAKKKGYRVAVIVSAMGRKGESYATDTLLSIARTDKLSGRDIDLLLSCGEIISGVVLVSELQAEGEKAAFLTGSQAGIITDRNYGNARILKVDARCVEDLLSKGNIVVIAGYQGVSEDGEITTLGRGGSDTTAAAIGVALDAEAIEIYTDVDGIKTADPRIVSEAKTLDTITYNEVCQLAHEGAKVIHPRAVEIAMQKHIPLWIKSTFDNKPGTLVTVGKEGYEIPTCVNDRLVTGVTHVSGITQIKIITESSPGKFQKKVLRALADAGISIDFININPETIVFTVKDDMASRAVNIIEELGFTAQVTPNCAKVAAVGAGMTGRPGVMASIVEVLEGEGIPILQSADSYTTIWCLVNDIHLIRAVKALHRKFLPS